MNILAVTDSSQKMVDWWRIENFINNSKTDGINFTIRPTVFEDRKFVDDRDLDEALEELKKYDAIWLSYHYFFPTSANPKEYNPQAMTYVALKIARERYGVKIIIDIDDNVWGIPPYHPAIKHLTSFSLHILFTVLGEEDNYITTTTEVLKDQITYETRNNQVYVLPNMISNEYISPTTKDPDIIKIGWAGGNSHAADLHSSKMLLALEKLMHENRKIHFYSVGMPIVHSLPSKRKHIIPAVPIAEYKNKLFPTMNFDIFIAPLIEDNFNIYKSDIKWQEATKLGATFIGSNTPPYFSVEDGVTGYLTQNTFNGWYDAFNKALKKPTADNAQKALPKIEAFNLFDFFATILR